MNTQVAGEDKPEADIPASSLDDPTNVIGGPLAILARDHHQGQSTEVVPQQGAPMNTAVPERIKVFGKPDGPRFTFHVSKFMHGDALCMQAPLASGMEDAGTYITGAEAERLAGRWARISIYI